MKYEYIFWWCVRCKEFRACKNQPMPVCRVCADKPADPTQTLQDLFGVFGDKS